jgi:hypothetical protein
MLRVVSAVLATLVLAGAASADTPYRDREGRFSLTVPTGWAANHPEDRDIALALTSPKADDAKGGLCLIVVRDLPQTRDVPQAELDEAFGDLLTPEFWKASFEAAGIKDVVVQSSGKKQQRGRQVYFVVANTTGTDDNGQLLEAVGRQELHVVPGSMHFVNCTAPKALYAAMGPAFTLIFASFTPHPGQLLVKAPSPQATPSVLSLYAGPNFAGATRVIAQDTPNVPALAGNGVTASIAIAGFGRWEVCEGVNYAGTCQVVSSSATAQNGQAMRIGSVRRYIVANDARAAAGVVSATTGTEFRAAVERMVKPRSR